MARTDERPVPTERAQPEANARLTGATAIVLLVLLAAEGVTILRVRPLLGWHVFLGMVVVPPTLLKIGTTSYRFARYYLGSPAYRRRGAPAPLMRLIGPLVVTTTAVVLASGIALLLAGPSWRTTLLELHKLSFVLWFGAMTIHVLGHLAETGRLAAGDWRQQQRSAVPGARLRQWVLATSVAVGIPLGLLLLGKVGPWTHSGVPLPH